MKPERLLCLYPRAWRDRYADEFLDACGDRPLTFQQTLDIVGGAIDARFAPQSHLTADGGRRTEGVTMTVNPRAICAQRGVPYTKVDGLKGAAAIVIGSFALLGISAELHRNGWHEAGKFVKDMSFPVSMLLSAHFTFMKGQSRTAKTVILGGTTAILILIGAFATRL